MHTAIHLVTRCLPRYTIKLLVFLCCLVQYICFSLICIHIHSVRRSHPSHSPQLTVSVHPSAFISFAKRLLSHFCICCNLICMHKTDSHALFHSCARRIAISFLSESVCEQWWHTSHRSGHLHTRTDEEKKKYVFSSASLLFVSRFVSFPLH